MGLAPDEDVHRYAVTTAPLHQAGADCAVYLYLPAHAVKAVEVVTAAFGHPGQAIAALDMAGVAGAQGHVAVVEGDL
ncbi:hypothetical protein D3C79_631050 [compost metagenome]